METAEIQHYDAAFHLDLHCLPKYPFWGFQTANMENPPIHGRADVFSEAGGITFRLNLCLFSCHGYASCDLFIYFFFIIKLSGTIFKSNLRIRAMALVSLQRLAWPRGYKTFLMLNSK